jgi:hypothetical protein
MRFDIRFAAALLLLAPAAVCTLRTSNELTARRDLRTDLAELGHVRYGMFNADRWVEQILPILNKQIDALDLTAQNGASLRPMVEQSLYRLLDQVKDQVAPKPKPGDKPNFAAAAMAVMANGMIANLRPQVPQFARTVLLELGSKDNKRAIRNYLDGIIAEGAKNTFSPVDMTAYRAILKEHGCADVAACRAKLSGDIAAADLRIEESYMAALGAAALAFLVLLVKSPPLRWYHVLVMLLFCIVLLAGGIFSPMLEVEAKVSRVAMTFFGEPISFDEQVFYYQSKTVLEVFRTLLDIGQPQMWIVAVLLLTFSVIFPVLKIVTLGVCLGHMEWLRKNRILRFFALESSKWSMADVLALAIFMSFVAFNGVISSAMAGMQSPGAQIVVPTDSSKILGGFYLFVGFVLASLFLSWRLERELRALDFQSRVVE